MENLSELIEQFNRELSRIIEERKIITTPDVEGEENFWKYTKLCQLLKQILETYTKEANLNPGIILYLVHIFIPLIIKKGKQVGIKNDEIVEENTRIYFDIMEKRLECGYMIDGVSTTFEVSADEDNSTIKVSSELYYGERLDNQSKQEIIFAVTYDENGLIRNVQIDKLFIIPRILQCDYDGREYLSLTYTIDGKNIAVTSRIKQNRILSEPKEHLCIEEHSSEETELSSAIQVMLPVVPGVTGFDITTFLPLIHEVCCKTCSIENCAQEPQIKPDGEFVNLIWKVFPNIVNSASDKFKYQHTREKVLTSTQ